jgi:hypothetical protein
VVGDRPEDEGAGDYEPEDVGVAVRRDREGMGIDVRLSGKARLSKEMRIDLDVEASESETNLCEVFQQ